MKRHASWRKCLGACIRPIATRIPGSKSTALICVRGRDRPAHAAGVAAVEEVDGAATPRSAGAPPRHPPGGRTRATGSDARRALARWRRESSRRRFPTRRQSSTPKTWRDPRGRRRTDYSHSFVRTRRHGSARWSYQKPSGRRDDEAHSKLPPPSPPLKSTSYGPGVRAPPELEAMCCTTAVTKCGHRFADGHCSSSRDSKYRASLSRSVGASNRCRCDGRLFEMRALRRVDHEGIGDDEQVVAVRCGFRGFQRAHEAAAAVAILDHHRLLGPLGDPLPDRSRDRVASSARLFHHVDN